MRGGRWRLLVAGKVALGLVSLLMLGFVGYVWVQYTLLEDGMHRSGALAGEAGSLNGDTNILIMGLDSRLDENGNPLPAAIYDALHAGDASDGGQNANVLMLLHVPYDGGHATSISIPRDDYVDLPGCPDQQCHGKIKQAYGLAFDAQRKKLAGQDGLSQAEKTQQERDAGRRAEVDAVRRLLGGVPVDHFVEITLVAFFQIAQVVQPITVCVNENTEDGYSGAAFRPGQQQINAEQAVAFVRQRRDEAHPQLNFTDLDRERRQQAFIASLAYQLKQGGALGNPAKMQGILDVAKQNIATDSTLNLLTFAGQASQLTGGNVSFRTLPVDHFGKDAAGEDVNIVNVAALQALVRQWIGGTVPLPPPSATPPDSEATGPPPDTVEVINANGHNGLAAIMARVIQTKGFTPGAISNGSQRRRSEIAYPAGASAAAARLSTILGGMATHQDPRLAAGHLQAILGIDFPLTPALTGPSAALPDAVNPTPPVDTGEPDTSDALTATGGIPCVK